MNTIFKGQKALQEAYHRISSYPSGELTVGEAYNDLLHLKFCIESECIELLEALGDGSRDIHKPWKKRRMELFSRTYYHSDRVKEEAMDVLSFAVNICLSVGITPESVQDEYEKVFRKNMKRAAGVRDAGD